MYLGCLNECMFVHFIRPGRECAQQGKAIAPNFEE